MATPYMHIDPPVIDGGGSVTAEGFVGWMELTGLTATVERAIKQTAEFAKNREAAHPQIQAFGCTRQADRATPKMFGWSVGGKPRKVTIKLCTPGAKGVPLPYCEYVMDNCVLSKFVLKDDADGAPEEDFEVSFTKIDFKFQATDSKGGQQLAGAATYDLVINKLIS